MLIKGKWVESNRRSEIKNPYSGKKVGTVSMATGAEVLDAAADAKKFSSALTAYERYDILMRTAQEVEKDSRDYVASISSESGMCVKDAAKEVARAVSLLKVSAEEAKRITGESIFTDVVESAKRNLAVTIREPIGLVCAITPFNRPLNQVVVKLGPAIAANNSVILKPSEKTPLTAIKFVKALINNGLPPRMVAVVTGDPAEIGDALVSCPHIDMVTFTGSKEVGEHIAKTAGMVKLTLELGDSGALIVMDDADLAKAVKTAVAGAYGNAGQSCRGIKRILVHKNIEEAFVRGLKEATEKLKVGDPQSEDTDIGTLINEVQALEVEKRIADAVNKGARLVCGGTRKKAQITPAILTNVPRDAAIVMKETFGPCAPVVTVNDIEDAVSYVNATEYGLQTGIFTNDLAKAFYAAGQLKVGAVIVNNGPQFDSPAIPFGGVKKSGLGREGIKYAVNEMTTVKTIVF
ncbi:MAG: aldehyde dehydrogenase family protein [Candidatus Omnitrophica bacterium]|nr:aldehyde dehydrogenase family protein [Candidatus Omnitrophota bacterium]